MSKIELYRLRPESKCFEKKLARWQEFNQMPAPNGIKHTTSVKSGYSSQRIYIAFLKGANLFNHGS